MKPVAFDYHRPTSLQEALEWLNQHPDGKILAGGQSLIPLMNFRMSRPAALLDINTLPELAEVRQTETGLRLGGLIRHQQLHEHPLVHDLCPVLSEAAGHVGHWAIRNRGTLGGSLVHADPASELPAAMVALQATFELSSVGETRHVPAHEFYLGFLTTDIRSDELLTAVEIPHRADAAWGFSEFSRRSGDFALAGAFVARMQDGTGAVTWFGISVGPERRVLAFPADDEARRAALVDLVEEFDPLEEGPYRKHLAVTAAEQAYQRSLGRLDR